MDSNKSKVSPTQGQITGQQAGRGLGSNPLVLALVVGNIVSLLSILLPIAGNILGGLAAGYLYKGGLKRSVLVGVLSQVVVLVLVALSFGTAFSALNHLPLNGTNSTYNSIGINVTQLNYLKSHGSSLGNIEVFVTLASVVLLALMGAIGGLLGGYIYKKLKR